MRCLLTFCLLAIPGVVIQSADKKPAQPATKEIYRDKSWQHIGNGNFSPQSDGASDLTVESLGESLAIKITIDEAILKELNDKRWKSVEFQGEVIGNDTGKFGGCTATLVKLDGKEIGKITKSGHFRIAFDKSKLPKAPNKKIEIQIQSGNAAGDADDQELGQFVLRLSEREPPKIKKNQSKDDTVDEPGSK